MYHLLIIKKSGEQLWFNSGSSIGSENKCSMLSLMNLYRQSTLFFVL